MVMSPKYSFLTSGKTVQRIQSRRESDFRELTVREMLDDTIVKQVMRRDGITELDVLRAVDAARASLKARRGH
jgi:hypothetical protein